MRQMVEKEIVSQAVTDLLAAGYSLEVDIGDGPEHEPTKDRAIIDKHLFSGDEARLFVYKDGKKKPHGWVYFVYGNDGWDVISDHSVHLEKDLAKANEIADKYK
jgi:hypothetical protein